MAHTSMSLFEECKNVAAALQRKKVNFNKSLSKLLAKTYSVSLDETSKFGPREEVGGSECEKAVVELRRVMNCGELLVTQWTDKQWWKTVISSSDSASLQAKVVLHLKEFFECVKVLRVIANGNQNLLFDHRNSLLSEVRDLELSMSTVESDVEKACNEDLNSLKSWIQDKYIRGWLVKLEAKDVKLANLVLEQLRPPGNSSLGHRPSSKLEYTDVIIGNRLLGEGGAGKVLACEFLGLAAAAKVFLADRSNAKVVETEAQLFASLRHPNVVRFIAYVIDKDQHVIVSELMQMDLRNYLDEFNKGGDGSPRGLPLLEAIDIMLQIAQGMRYLHDGQMMHRDLKSKNVLVNVIPSTNSRVPSSVLEVKVTDFGLAKLKTDNSRYTTKGVGTTKWRAPEVFEDDNNPGKYKKSADVYSFAIVFFEVLTGETPFDGIPLGKLLQKLHSGLRPRLPRNECPEYLSALIKKCWSRNAARRPTFATICKTLVNCKVAFLLAQSPSPRSILSYDLDDESISPSRLCSNCHFSCRFI
ncbi:unnamed protein product [Sphagnum jensenii]|uniref:Protein kinase domain-containing protein n=1 Tax=Sphagnum jensenii TaxID=128206 RepID=A0ABP0ZXX0_9BRYO